MVCRAAPCTGRHSPFIKGDTFLLMLTSMREEHENTPLMKGGMLSEGQKGGFPGGTPQSDRGVSLSLVLELTIIYIIIIEIVKW